MATITIDPLAGFCPGVSKAIAEADNLLDTYPSVYSFGELVHCPEELNRLESAGLRIMSREDLDTVTDSVVLIRAHGVTPRTHFRLELSNNTIIDATCSIVRRLQQKVKICSHEMKKVDGQVIIFGKKKHPEVEGLTGYSAGVSIVVEDTDIPDEIDLSKPMAVFAQTTSNVADYETFIANLYAKLDETGNGRMNLSVYNTICGSMKVRVPKLQQFAREHEVIIMVAGEQSSNGRYLSGIVLNENPRTYKISDPVELKADWFKGVQTIGISGATSTPAWLLQKTADAVSVIIEQINDVS